MNNILLRREKLDPSNMYDAISKFPYHIEHSIELFKDWNPKNSYNDIRTIIILGMGGSAIGGDVARVMVQDSCKVPIIVNRNYQVPAWIDSSTLVIASSYSGNTEETLSAFNECLKVNAQIIVVSTGGELTRLAFEYDLDCITLPKSTLQPRAALGYSFSAILLLMNQLNIVGNGIVTKLTDCSKTLKSYGDQFKLDFQENEAIMIAKKIHHSIPVIYGSEDTTWVVSLRFRGQLAENSKMLSSHNHFPEQNHNEIEGWCCNSDLLKKTTIIWILDADDHPRTSNRMGISGDILSDISGDQFKIEVSGTNRIERLLKLIHFTDWISYYAALLNEVDPIPVNQISLLKSKMSEL